MMTTNNHDFKQFGSDEVIALHPDGVQRHHGEWVLSPLDDPESNL